MTYAHFMTPQTWLITGGAGYIGAHVADEFLANGKDVVIYDSLYRGLESRIEYLRKKYNKEIPLIVADIRDIDKFEDALSAFRPYGIIHTAALKAVGESMEKPDEYFEVNFQATKKMLEVIAKHGIKNFIFSSSAAVYGAPDHSIPIREDAPKNPISPYGASKLAAEGSVSEFLTTPGNHGTSLRFFNVIGAAAPQVLDNSGENLVPIVINKLKIGEQPTVYGADYPTPDGTCIRDYVDVRDIARAHLLAADSDSKLPFVMNVGTGHGASVREVINLISSFAGQTDVVVGEIDRRAGDSAFLCADASLIKTAIGFSPQYSLSMSMESLFI
jgi:UDP-glucose 4-epimerase